MLDLRSAQALYAKIFTYNIVGTFMFNYSFQMVFICCLTYSYVLPNSRVAVKVTLIVLSALRGITGAYSLYSLAYSCGALKRQYRQECHLHVNGIVCGACARRYRRVIAYTPALAARPMP